MAGRKGFRVWLGLVAVALLAGVVVPYGLLAAREGSLIVVAVWGVFGLGVIGLILWGVSGWRVKR